MPLTCMLCDSSPIFAYLLLLGDFVSIYLWNSRVVRAAPPTNRRLVLVLQKHVHWRVACHGFDIKIHGWK